MKILALAFLIVLAGCSSSETTPESSSLPLDEGTDIVADSATSTSMDTAASSSPVSADPFLDLASPEDTSALATPVDDTATSSSSSDPLLAGDESGSSSSSGLLSSESSSSLSNPSPSTIEAPPVPEPGYVTSKNPQPSSSATGLPPPSVSAGTEESGRRSSYGRDVKKDLYEDYDEYKKYIEAREAENDVQELRSLFAHEGGAYQFGIDYIMKPFGNYDVDPGLGVQKLDNTGLGLSYTYFPLRSLSLGRLGVGAQVAGVMTRYSFDTNVNGNNTVDVSRKLSFIVAGLKAAYEFQYWLGQTLVPYAFYSYEQVRYRGFALATANIDYPSKRFYIQSYGGGLNVNLNRFEQSAASKALGNTGIRKFYVSYAFKTDANNTGNSHYIGLKFEY